MIRMKYILQNMNVLNGLLAIVAAAMVYFIVIPFLNPDIRLCKKTFPEIKKWNSLAINSDWWEYTVLSITPASWFIS